VLLLSTLFDVLQFYQSQALPVLSCRPSPCETKQAPQALLQPKRARQGRSVCAPLQQRGAERGCGGGGGRCSGARALAERPSSAVCGGRAVAAAHTGVLRGRVRGQRGNVRGAARRARRQQPHEQLRRRRTARSGRGAGQGRAGARGLQVARQNGGVAQRRGSGGQQRARLRACAARLRRRRPGLCQARLIENHTGSHALEKDQECLRRPVARLLAQDNPEIGAAYVTGPALRQPSFQLA